MEKQYLHEKLIEIFKERLPEYKKEVIERRRQTDKVVIWVLGLSTGAIALILSHSGSPPVISLLLLKITVGFILATIISGVVFRVYFYTLEQIESDILLGVEGAFYGYSAASETYDSIEITDHHSIEDIATSLKEDLGFNYDDWLDHDYLTRDFWVGLYDRCAEFHRKTDEEGLKSFIKTLANIEGKKPEEIEDIFLKSDKGTKTSQNAISYRKVIYWSYNLMFLFFVLAIVTVAIGFIIK